MFAIAVAGEKKCPRTYTDYRIQAFAENNNNKMWKIAKGKQIYAHASSMSHVHLHRKHKRIAYVFTAAEVAATERMDGDRFMKSSKLPFGSITPLNAIMCIPAIFMLYTRARILISRIYIYLQQQI